MSSMFNRLLLCAALFAAASVPAAAGESPEAFMQRYVDAIRSDGVSAAADFVHPDEAERFRAMLAPLFAAMPEPQADAMAQTFFGGKADAAKVAAMPAGDFMRAFLRFVEQQAMGAGPGKGGIEIRQFDMLGSVPEGDVRHFVTRGTVAAGPITMTKMEVVSIRPDGDGWGMLLSGELDGMAQAIKASARRAAEAGEDRKPQADQ